MAWHFSVAVQSDRVAELEAALRGIASCATACPCCEMHARIARRALTITQPVMAAMDISISPAIAAEPIPIPNTAASKRTSGDFTSNESLTSTALITTSDTTGPKSALTSTQLFAPSELPDAGSALKDRAP